MCMHALSLRVLTYTPENDAWQLAEACGIYLHFTVVNFEIKPHNDACCINISGCNSSTSNSNSSEQPV